MIGLLVRVNGMYPSILRPGFFMENFNGTIGKITSAVMRCGLQPTTKQQLIVSPNSSHISHALFSLILGCGRHWSHRCCSVSGMYSSSYRIPNLINSQNPEAYVEAIIVVTGDALTTKEQDAAYKKATGHHLPSVPNAFAKLLLAVNSHTRQL